MVTNTENNEKNLNDFEGAMRSARDNLTPAEAIKHIQKSFEAGQIDESKYSRLLDGMLADIENTKHQNFIDKQNEKDIQQKKIDKTGVQISTSENNFADIQSTGQKIDLGGGLKESMEKMAKQSTFDAEAERVEREKDEAHLKEYISEFGEFEDTKEYLEDLNFIEKDEREQVLEARIQRNLEKAGARAERNKAKESKNHYSPEEAKIRSDVGILKETHDKNFSGEELNVKAIKEREIEQTKEEARIKKAKHLEVKNTVIDAINGMNNLETLKAGNDTLYKTLNELLGKDHPFQSQLKHLKENPSLFFSPEFEEARNSIIEKITDRYQDKKTGVKHDITLLAVNPNLFEKDKEEDKVKSQEEEEAKKSQLDRDAKAIKSWLSGLDVNQTITALQILFLDSNTPDSAKNFYKSLESQFDGDMDKAKQIIAQNGGLISSKIKNEILPNNPDAFGKLQAKMMDGPASLEGKHVSSKTVFQQTKDNVKDFLGNLVKLVKGPDREEAWSNMLGSVGLKTGLLALVALDNLVLNTGEAKKFTKAWMSASMSKFMTGAQKDYYDLFSGHEGKRAAMDNQNIFSGLSK